MKVNPLKYAQITVNCSVQFADLDQAIVFLGEARDRMKASLDAALYLRISQAEKRLDLGQRHDCLEILEEVRSELADHQDIVPEVYAYCADVFSQYYSRQEN